MKHHPQLPGHGQGQTKPSFLPGLSDQCNQSQKHGAGGEISSWCDLGEDILYDQCPTILFLKSIAPVLDQTDRFSRAAVCRGLSDTGLDCASAWARQAAPRGSPATGHSSSLTKDCHSSWEGLSHTVAAGDHGVVAETHGPCWHKNALHTPPALPRFWRQIKCLKH